MNTAWVIISWGIRSEMYIYHLSSNNILGMYMKLDRGPTNKEALLPIKNTYYNGDTLTGLWERMKKGKGHTFLLCLCMYMFL